MSYLAAAVKREGLGAVMTGATSTHLNPVAQTEREARLIAEARLNENATIPWWDIRKGWDGYYVVPPAPLGQGRWGVDVGYESLGNYVARVARAHSRLCPRCLGNDPPGALRQDDCTCRRDTR